MAIDIDLGNVEEAPILPAGGPYNLAYRKVELTRNKADDGDMFYCEIIVVGGTDSFIHYWSLKPGAVTAKSSAISIRKFFEVMGRPDLANLHITDDTIGDLLVELRQMTFVGTVKHELWNGDTQVKLESVLEAA